MKKLVLLFFLWAAVSAKISAQATYNHFVKDSVSWVISESYCDAFFNCDPGGSGPAVFHLNTYYYKLAGDTIVDSVQYKKMYLSFLTTCNGCPVTYPGHDTYCSPYRLVGYVNEDTLNRTVHYMGINAGDCWNPRDSLFMNFSLAVGDSFKLHYTATGISVNCDTSFFTVDSISNKGFRNYHVKTWFIHNSFDYTRGWGPLDELELYEGIGFLTGFDLFYQQGDGTHYARYLSNYCDAGDSTCNSPLKPNDVASIATPSFTVLLIPNPSTELVTIKSPDAYIDKVEVFDITGKSKMLVNANSLNVSSLSADMYLLRIYTNEGVAYRRLMKI